jgi:endonuclease/exonuclease/phosphatase (EEP) superfamily protein YafD
MSNLKSRKRKSAELILRILIYGYLIVVMGVWLLFRLEGDRWWFATLILYGPRWIYVAPLVALVPSALLLSRRLLVPLAVGGCLAVFCLMGLHLPWLNWGEKPRPDLRVLTFNAERHHFPGTAFSNLVKREKPDVISFQECSGPSRWSAWWQPREPWHDVRRGELRIASRFPIKRVEVSYSDWSLRKGPTQNAVYCVLETPQGDVGFCNVHLETPRRALSTVLDHQKILNLDNVDHADFQIECRRLESKDLLDWLRKFPDPKIVAGDFNLTSDSRIYRGDWNQFRNAFDQTGWGFGHTKQTVIRNQQYGLRIDHILTDERWTPVRCWVGPDVGSDHLPLFADIAMRPSGERSPTAENR